MPTRKRKEVRDSLSGKGFRETDKSSKHFNYTYEQETVGTSIGTSIWRGSKYSELGTTQLSMVAGDLKLQFSDFLDYVDCDYTKEMYEDFLREREILPQRKHKVVQYVPRSEYPAVRERLNDLVDEIDHQDLYKVYGQLNNGGLTSKHLKMIDRLEKRVVEQ